MREELLKNIEKLCWLFPQLKPSIRYTEELSKDEIDAFKALTYNSTKGIFGLSQTCHYGMHRIRQQDVLFVESALSAASGNDLGISQEMHNLIEILQKHPKTLQHLQNAYTKILKNELVNTCPFVFSEQPFFNRILGDTKEFHDCFHASIHFLLEEAGICFGDEEIDEGLVTYLHKQVLGNEAIKHYNDEQGRKYLNYANVFEQTISKYPRNAILPVIMRLKTKAQ